MMSAADLARALAANVEALAVELLPAGIRERGEWRIGSIAGEPGRSLAIHLVGDRRGLWLDRTNPDDAGDALDLVADVLFNGVSGRDGERQPMVALNPFEAFADTYTPRPVKTRRRRPASRQDKSAKDKRLEERGRLATHYRREEARRTAEALNSPQGKRLASLLAEFDQLTIDDADVMIARVEAQDWLLWTDEDFRRLALRLIDQRIGRIRRDARLIELDDPLPGEPDSAFFIIKRLLRVI